MRALLLLVFVGLLHHAVGQYTVVAPSTAQLISPFLVVWTAPASHSVYDQIYLYSGVPVNQKYIVNVQTVTSNYVYSTDTSGNLTFSFSDPSLVYFCSYYVFGSSTSVANSDIIEPNVSGYSLELNTESPSVYDSLSVNWTAPYNIGYDNELILFSIDNYGEWTQVDSVNLPSGSENGTVSFSPISSPGLYVVGYYYDYYSNYLLAQTNSFQVNAEGFTLSLSSNIGIYQPFTVSWTAPANHNLYDSINIYMRNSDGSSSSVTYSYVNAGGYDKGTVTFTVNVPGTYYAVYNLYQSGIPVQQSSDFQVSVIGYSITPSTPAYVQTPITVAWTAPANHEQDDTIYLYQLQEDNSLTQVSYSYVGSAGYTSGSITFYVAAPGTYQCQYKLYSNQQVIVTSQMFNATTYGYGITMSSSTVYIYTSFTVSWTAPAQHTQSDKIVLYYENPPNVYTNVASQYINSAGYSYGTLNFEVDAAGSYIAVYELYDSNVFVPVSSVSFTAQINGYSLKAPGTVNINKAFSVAWTAPSDHSGNDIIVLAMLSSDLDAFKNVNTMYVSGQGYSSGSVQFTVSTAGTYLCLYQLNSNEYLAASGIITAH